MDLWLKFLAAKYTAVIEYRFFKIIIPVIAYRIFFLNAVVQNLGKLQVFRKRGKSIVFTKSNFHRLFPPSAAMEMLRVTESDGFVLALGI